MIILCFIAPDVLIIIGNIRMCSITNISTVDPIQLKSHTSSWCNDGIMMMFVASSAGFTFALCVLEELLRNIDWSLLDCVYGLIPRMIDCMYNCNKNDHDKERIFDQLVKFEPSIINVVKPTKQDILQFARLKLMVHGQMKKQALVSGCRRNMHTCFGDNKVSKLPRGLKG